MPPLPDACQMSPEMEWVNAYGAVIGALMVASVVGVVIALLPRKALERILPPVVSGLTVVLIGASLADTCLQFWGGGPGCSRYTPISNCGIYNETTGGN